MSSQPKKREIKPRTRSPVDRLRARVWYRAVKCCGNWTDYKLDMQFGQKVEATTKDGMLRNRVFGVIGKKGSLPSRGGHHRRAFNLIERVDNHPEFKGTARVIDSPFWELLKLPPGDLEETTSFAAKCLALMGLTRLNGKTALEWMWYAGDEIFRAGRGSLKSTGAGPYEACLNDALAGLPCDLDLLALLGALYREACLSFNPENAEILGVSFRLTLERFCSEQWLEPHGLYLQDLALNRILYGKGDYLPAESDSESSDRLELMSMPSQGLVVALDNPKLKYFLENTATVSVTHKCWMIALMPAEEVGKVDWIEPLSNMERDLIEQIRHKFQLHGKYNVDANT